MSIIEKAAGRLAKNAGGPAHTTAETQPASAPAVHSAGSAEPVETAQPEQPVEAVTPAIAAAPTRSKPAPRKVELDLAKLQAAGMVTPAGGRSAIAEEFRAIKWSLISRAFEKPEPECPPNNLIMVTSSLPGEGKTFCSINLALSIAKELDHTVLLVDADVARPSVLRNLGLEAELGLMDVLVERKVDIADVLLKTNVDTLSILPAGTSHRHATELLASQTMSQLLHQVATRYSDRIVIFDSPPLLMTSEARVLASQMGQIVMVVEAERTTQNTLRNALRQIEKCSNLNLIYNKAKPFPSGDGYGYYYN